MSTATSLGAEDLEWDPNPEYHPHDYDLDVNPHYVVNEAGEREAVVLTPTEWQTVLERIDLLECSVMSLQGQLEDEDDEGDPIPWEQVKLDIERERACDTSLS